MTPKDHLNPTELANKAKGYARDHPDQARSLVVRLEAALNSATRGRFSGIIDKGSSAVQKHIGISEEQDTEQNTEQGTGTPPEPGDPVPPLPSEPTLPDPSDPTPPDPGAPTPLDPPEPGEPGELEGPPRQDPRE